jgi:predicted DNA binding CopG/RHH family protein
MKKSYDFSKGIKNPYADLVKRQITIRIEDRAIKYFKSMASNTGIPYQNLINLYLSDCALKNRKLSFNWN